MVEGPIREAELAEQRAEDRAELAAVLIRQLRHHHDRNAVPRLLELLDEAGYLVFPGPLQPIEARRLADAIERAGFRILPPPRRS